MRNNNLLKEGEVIETLPNTTFRVKLADNSVILCHLSGKIRLNKIKVMMGDKVRVEISPYDQQRGRIIYRIK